MQAQLLRDALHGHVMNDVLAERSESSRSRSSTSAHEEAFCFDGALDGITSKGTSSASGGDLWRVVDRY